MAYSRKNSKKRSLSRTRKGGKNISFYNKEREGEAKARARARTDAAAAARTAAAAARRVRDAASARQYAPNYPDIAHPPTGTPPQIRPNEAAIYMMCSQSENVNKKIIELIEKNSDQGISTEVFFSHCPFNLNYNMKPDGYMITDGNVAENRGKEIFEILVNDVVNKKCKFYSVDVPAVPPMKIPYGDFLKNHMKSNWPRLGNPVKNLFFQSFTISYVFDMLVHINHIDETGEMARTHNEENATVFNKFENIETFYDETLKQSMKNLIKHIFFDNNDSNIKAFELLISNFIQTLPIKDTPPVPEGAKILLDLDVYTGMTNEQLEPHRKSLRTLKATLQQSLEHSQSPSQPDAVNNMNSAILDFYNKVCDKYINNNIQTVDKFLGNITGFKNIETLFNNITTNKLLPNRLRKFDDKTGGIKPPGSLEGRRLDTALKRQNDYSGVFADGMSALGVLGFHYNELNDENLPLSNKPSPYVINDYDNSTLNNTAGYSFIKLTQTKPLCDIVTSNLNSSKQGKYSKIDVISDNEIDDILAIKTLAPHFTEMEIHLCQIKGTEDFTNTLKRELKKELELTKPAMVRISDNRIHAFSNLRQIIKHYKKGECFDFTDTANDWESVGKAADSAYDTLTGGGKKRRLTKRRSTNRKRPTKIRRHTKKRRPTKRRHTKRRPTKRR